jgi:hypothetical protein
MASKRNINENNDSNNTNKLSKIEKEINKNTLEPYPYGIGPTCFHGFEINLEDFIDLNRYPIHDLRSPKRKELVDRCKKELADSGCCLLSSFITADAVKEMAAEATRLMIKRTKQCESYITPYLSPPTDEFEEEHPRNFLQRRTQSFIDSCLLEEQSLYRKFYDSDVVLHFISECIDVRIYRWPCPIARSVYSVMEEGDYLPWHFDRNQFTVSILVQDSDSGGNFEYCPFLRHYEIGKENYDEVKDILFDKDRSKVQVLPLKVGDVQIFRGENTLHRVSPAVGKTPRLIALPSYIKDPFFTGHPTDVDFFYGRHFPIHEDRHHIKKFN